MKKHCAIFIVLLLVLSALLVSCSSDPVSKPQDSNQITEEIGLFGMFEEINTRESYLGYGINIINADAITSNNVQMNFPIFDTEKLRNERLLKSNEHYNRFVTIEGSTIEAFSMNMSDSISITSGRSASAVAPVSDSVSIGASASMSRGITGRFAHTLDTTESQYFVEIVSENQSYWLILQSSEARYKEILSDEFKKDLYDPNVEPAQLFDKYGTHLLTSVAMGGNICMFYTFSSEEKETSNSVYFEVSRTLKANIAAAFGDFGASAGISSSFSNVFTYQDVAIENNININTSIESAGGEAYGINSEQMLYARYYDWQKSLDSRPVLIGIKDSNSLYPIWNLLDMSVEGAAARYEELYNYFQEYGADSYNRMCELYSITPAVNPEGLKDIKVDGRTLDSSELAGLIDVKAGETVFIGFDVVPENATKYKKSFSLADNGAYYMDEEIDPTDGNSKPVRKSYVEFEGNGCMHISSDMPSGTSFAVKLSAGSVSKTINFYVRSSYSVVFNTRVEGLSVPTKIGIEFGSYINEPMLNREGYWLDGWYLDASNTRKFDFEEDVIEGNTTLYAKWVAIKPNVVFNSAGGSTVPQQTVAYKGTATEPRKPDRTGYTFGGWYTDEECTELFDFATNLTEDVTLHAKWNLVEYRVDFETETVQIAPEYASIETGYLITAPDITKKYYTLSGWYLDSAYSKRYDFSTAVSSNMTLYAKWECIDYPVKFLDMRNNPLYDEYDVLIKDQTANYEDGFLISDVNNPMIEGHVFEGWYWNGSRIDGKLSSYDGFKPSNDGMIIVRAHFDEEVHNVNVIFKADETVEGLILPDNYSQTVAFGETYSILRESLPSIAGYYPDKPAYEVTMGHSDLTITVTYKIQSFDLVASCRTKDGKELATVPLGTYKYMEEYDLPSPAVKGYSSIDERIKGSMDKTQKKTVMVEYSPVTVIISLEKGDKCTNGETLKTAITLNESTKDIVFDTNASITIPTAMYYKFIGWYTFSGIQVTDKNGKPLSNVASILENGKWRITEDITLYAHWEKADEYKDYTYISDRTGLESIEKNPKDNYLIVKDISLGSDNWVPINGFEGTLDGAGHIIYGMRITLDGGTLNTNIDHDFGLFKLIHKKGIVKDLILQNCSITISANHDGAGKIYAGLLCGRNYGTVQRIMINDGEESILRYNSRVGGACGGNYGIIDNCFITGLTLGENGDLGGLVGYNFTGKISESYVRDYKINFYVTEENRSIGGLVGALEKGTIENCFVFQDTYCYLGSDGGMHNIVWLIGAHDGCSLRPRIGRLIGHSAGSTWTDNKNNDLNAIGSKTLEWGPLVSNDDRTRLTGGYTENRYWFKEGELVGCVGNIN